MVGFGYGPLKWSMMLCIDRIPYVIRVLIADCVLRTQPWQVSRTALLKVNLYNVGNVEILPKGLLFTLLGMCWMLQTGRACLNPRGGSHKRPKGQGDSPDQRPFLCPCCWRKPLLLQPHEVEVHSLPRENKTTTGVHETKKLWLKIPSTVSSFSTHPTSLPSYSQSCAFHASNTSLTSGACFYCHALSHLAGRLAGLQAPLDSLGRLQWTM